MLTQTLEKKINFFVQIISKFQVLNSIINNIHIMESRMSTENPPQTSEKKQNLVKLSIKSRHSDDSVFSNPYTYLENPNNYFSEGVQKMSIQSNISEKMKTMRRKSDLFENLASEMIVEQPFPRKNRPSTEDYKFPEFDFPRNRMFEINRLSSDMIIETEPLINTQQNPLGAELNMIKEEMQSKEESNVVEAPKSISCKCFKSKCVQMYCECFSKGIYCKKGECQCYSCRNDPDFKIKVDKARQEVLERNPDAFTNKLEVVGNTETQKSLAYKKGCNCKKTLCFKKYCECWNSGVKCTYLCKCESCLNGGERAFKQ